MQHPAHLIQPKYNPMAMDSMVTPRKTV